jgi:glycosyltransferase involved in cell wall biosynthesis
MRMALKQLVLTQKELRRHLEARQTRPDVVERLGESASRNPRVSVVMTVFNYAHTVGDAIHSVAASENVECELVIVDDASTDASLTAIRGALEQHPSLPTTLVLRGGNQGLPRARNTGVEHASGEYVFILDADNAVYPHCLARLAHVLDADPGAAFAYGILEVFDPSGPRDLMSWRPWDPERLRYGNYVDAMAMIRRTVLESVGGYSTDPRLYGWEDFALWCTLADRGWRGVRVPEIVARYRKGLQSMISVTDIDGRDAWAALLESHPILTTTDA